MANPRVPGPVGLGVPGAPGSVPPPGPVGMNDAAAPERYWTAAIKGHLGEHPVAYHTLNNFSDTPLRYLLRISNRGRCLLSLETQYRYRTTGLQRAWTAIFAQSGKSAEVTNGLPAHTSLHLRLFGERDHTEPDQSWCEGTVEVLLRE